jgi:hypothetical protein
MSLVLALVATVYGWRVRRDLGVALLVAVLSSVVVMLVQPAAT